MHDWKDSSRGVLAGAVTGVVFGVGGFFATEIPGTHAMGLVVFVLVPLAAGFAITMVSHGLQRVSAAAMLATLVSLAILIATGLETVLCALIAFPLLLAGLLIGVALGYLFLKLKDKFGGDGGAVHSSSLAIDATYNSCRPPCGGFDTHSPTAGSCYVYDSACRRSR